MTNSRDLANLGGGFIQAGGGVQRSVESKLKDVVSVLDFIPQAEHAAIKAGTSTYDATAAIQAAIDSINTKGGGSLYVPEGRYKLTSTVTLKPGVSILGERKGEWAANPAPGVVFDKQFTTGSVFNSPNTQTLHSVSLENFYIEGNKGGAGGNTGDGISIANAASCIFRNVWIKEAPSNGFSIGSGSSSYHNYFYNCYAFFNGASGYLVRSDWARIVDCWADGNYIGIEFPATNAGSNSFIDRCHFEEWEFAAIAIRGNPGITGPGNHTISQCRFFSRPYQASWPAHCIFLDGSTGASGCSQNRILNNRFAYEGNYVPSNAGKRAVYMYGGSCLQNVISQNAIGGFDTGIEINNGSVKTIVDTNDISACVTGVLNNASQTVISNNIFTANTTDLTDTGTAAVVSGNNFSVAPVLHTSDYCSNNNLGSIGTFQPTVAFSGGGTGITYASRTGRFERVGRHVHYWFDITLTSKGSDTGILLVDLPVPPRSGVNTVGNAWFYSGTTVTTTSFCYVNASTAQLNFLSSPTAFVSDGSLTNTAGFSGYVCYEAL